MNVLTKTASDVYSPYDSSGTPRSPSLSDAVVYHTEIERGLAQVPSIIDSAVKVVNDKVDELSVSGDTVTKATWEQLSAVTGTRIGQRGYVEADDGNHSDTVVGGTVPNMGIYTWSGSAWQWLRHDDLTDVENAQTDLLRSTRSNALGQLTPTQGFMSEQTAWVGQPTVDSFGNVIAGVDTDFNFRARMLDAPGVPALTDEFPYVWLTEDGYILFGFTCTGQFIVGGVSSGIRAFTRDVNGKSCVFVVVGNRKPVQITFGENDCVAPDATAHSVSWIELSDDATNIGNEDLLGRHSFNASVSALTHVAVYGQSLADGGAAVPVQTTAPVKPGYIATFNTGPRVRGSLQAENPMPKSHILSFVDLYEKVNETPVSQLCNQLSKEAALSSGFVGTVHARGGFTYDQLKKGTVPFDNLIMTVRRARIMADLNGMQYKMPAVSWVQGEANRLTSLQDYLAYMLELQADLAAEIGRYVDNNDDEVLLFVDQISNWTAYNLSSSDVPLAQLQASHERSDKIFCVCPKYHLPTVDDGIHLTGASSALLGAYHGRAIRQTLAGDPWVPLQVETAVRSGSDIDLTFIGGSGEIVLDTVSIVNPGNYGITWRQSGGAPVSISSVTKTGARTLRVTLSADPGAVTSQFIDIAMQAPAGSHAGPTSGARSCIRDSSPDLDAFGAKMYNWACHQICAVTA